MAHHWTAGAIAFAFCITANIASAGTVGGAVDQLVNDCAYNAGVQGNYHVTPTRYGSVAAYSVPPGADVSNAQSRQINACIAAGVTGKPQRTATTTPTSIDACLEAYHYKMSTTGYEMNTTGHQILENEYDRCINHVTYIANRCPTGLFVGGAGYCIKRPYR